MNKVKGFLVVRNTNLSISLIKKKEIDSVEKKTSFIAIHLKDDAGLIAKNFYLRPGKQLDDALNYEFSRINRELLMKDKEGILKRIFSFKKESSYEKVISFYSLKEELPKYFADFQFVLSDLKVLTISFREGIMDAPYTLISFQLADGLKEFKLRDWPRPTNSIGKTLDKISKLVFGRVIEFE
jgi:hypothetical protein